MAKYGAILAQGIIDAGGRNVTVSLQSRTGHTNLQAVVGMLIFTQYWYWFPLAHCLSLAFTPTCVIALNSDLRMPKMEFKSAAKPSLYAYPLPLEEKKAEEREKVATAVLSIAARQKRRETVDKRDNEDKMEVDEDVKEVMKDSKAADGKSTDAKSTDAAAASAPAPAPAAAPATPKDAEKPVEKEEKKKSSKSKSADDAQPGTSTDDAKEEKPATKPERKEPEPNFEILQNPARAIRQQLKVISFVDGQAYIPLKDVTIGGIIMTLRNARPGDADEVLVEPMAACGPKGDESKEPEAPEPFEYNDE